MCDDCKEKGNCELENSYDRKEKRDCALKATCENAKEGYTLKEAYKEAIVGYKFQFERYKDWMILYGGFIIALFVGYYTVANDRIAPKFVIAWLGTVTSFFCLLSFKGHRSWCASWMKLVRYYEDKLHTNTEEKSILGGNGGNRVFSVVFVNADTKYVGYSSQKILKCFIWIVMLIWSSAFVLTILELWSLCEQKLSIWHILLCIVFGLLVFAIIVYRIYEHEKGEDGKCICLKDFWKYLQHDGYLQSDVTEMWKIDDDAEGRKGGKMRKTKGEE